jgi:hypothetical protein
MEKDPAHRIQTADALAGAFGDLDSGFGRDTGWFWSDERAREWWTLHRGESPASDARSAPEGVATPQLVTKWR